MPGRLVDEVESGDRLRALKALRLELATAIDSCTNAGDLAALALRLTRVLEQIEDLGGAGNDGEGEDDLAARRDAKLRAAAGP